MTSVFLWFPPSHHIESAGPHMFETCIDFLEFISVMGPSAISGKTVLGPSPQRGD